MSDVSLWKRVNRELYKRFMKNVDVYIYDRNTHDPFYGENIDKTFDNMKSVNTVTYSIEGYFPILPESDVKLTKFGLDTVRKLSCFFFYDSFEEAGVKRPGIGDYIKVEGDKFKIMQTNPRDYFINSQIPMTFECELSLLRPESITTKPRTALEDDLYPVSQIKRSGA